MNTEKKSASVSWVPHDAEFKGRREARDERNRPKGPDLCQPRATPWESDSKGTPSPNGAALNESRTIQQQIAPSRWGYHTFCKPFPGALPRLT